jgi:hypothetical protein
MKLPNCITVRVDGDLVEESECMKFLGVTLDNRVNWKFHILDLHKKLSAYIGIFVKLRKIFSTQTLLTIYHAFISSRLCYAVEVWGLTYKTKIEKIYLKQKAIIRVMMGVPRFSASAPLFQQLGVKTIYQIVVEKVIILIYKLRNDLLTIPNLNIKPIDSKYDTRSKNAGCLKVPKVISDQGLLSLSFKGPRWWNAMDKSIRTAGTLGKIKTTLKNYLSHISVDDIVKKYFTLNEYTGINL